MPLGYLLGMLQSAEIVGRMVGRNPRTEGSNNPGASNMYRLAGRNAGGIVLLIDVLKGAVPAAVGFALDGRPLGLAAAGAAVVGHVYPFIRRFHGGKGVATFGGLTLILWPIAGTAGFTTWIVLLKLSGRPSVASLAGIAVTIGAVIFLGAPGWAIAGLAALSLLIVYRHRANIVRLLQGTEAPVG